MADTWTSKAEVLIAEGKTTADIAKLLGISYVAVLTWRKQFGFCQKRGRPPRKFDLTQVLQFVKADFSVKHIAESLQCDPNYAAGLKAGIKAMLDRYPEVAHGQEF